MHAPKSLSRTAGLTLVEVLTAISLFGVVSAIAVTNFREMTPSFQTRGAALLIAGDLNQARMSAIKEGRLYDFFPLAGGYRIRHDDGVGGRVVDKERVLFNEYPHVTFAHSGISLDPYDAPVGAAVPAATITFHSNGTIQNPASVYLESESTDPLAQQAVTLSAAGRVRVWKKGTTGWK